LDAVGRALEGARHCEEVFEGIGAAAERDPVFVVAIGATNVKIAGSGGAGDHAFLMVLAAVAATWIR